MADIRLSGATILTYGGFNINDGAVYKAHIDANVMASPPGRSILADVDFDWPFFVGVEKQARTFNLHIFILNRADYEARLNELKRWFNTQSGGEQYLIATFGTDPLARRIACRPVAVTFADVRCVVTLEAYSPYWESNVEQTATLVVVAHEDNAVMTNTGNLATMPLVELTLTASPVSTWLWRRNVLVANGCGQPLRNYPLELTGGWDTAALVVNAAKATTLDGAIDAAVTTVTVVSTAAFYGRGLIFIGSEQIFYAGKTGTTFTGCVRGVGGTTATNHAHNAAVNQSEMFADGRDVQIDLDGKPIPRWFGAAMGAATGPNRADTRLWAVIPNLEARNADWKEGYLLSPGNDLAKGRLVTVGSFVSGFPGAHLVDDKSGTLWRSATATGIATINLGMQRVMNRVLILHPNSADAPRDFTILTSPDAITWTTQITVTNNTARNRYTVHNFAARVTARHVRVNVTALQTGGKNCTIATISVYNAQARLVVKYGNCDAPEHTVTLDTQPMFKLNTSTNTSWDYADFSDDIYPRRAAQWTAFQYQPLYADRFRKYATSQDGVDADPAAVLGIAATTWPPYHDAYRLNHPGGITRVVHSGFTRTNTAHRTWRLGSIDAKAVTVPNRYENTVNSPAAWTAYGPVTTNISPAALTVFFYLFHKASTSGANFAEATDATLTLTGTPTVIFQDANATGTVFQLTCEIENKTAAQSFLIDALVDLNQVFEIDCRRFTVTEQATGVNRLPMLSLPAGVVRIPWLELVPGANTIAFNDTAVGGATVTLRWRSRWL